MQQQVVVFNTKYLKSISVTVFLLAHIQATC